MATIRARADTSAEKTHRELQRHFGLFQVDYFSLRKVLDAREQLRAFADQHAEHIDQYDGLAELYFWHVAELCLERCPDHPMATSFRETLRRMREETRPAWVAVVRRLGMDAANAQARRIICKLNEGKSPESLLRERRGLLKAMGGKRADLKLLPTVAAAPKPEGHVYEIETDGAVLLVDGEATQMTISAGPAGACKDAAHKQPFTGSRRADITTARKELRFASGGGLTIPHGSPLGFSRPVKFGPQLRHVWRLDS